MGLLDAEAVLQRALTDPEWHSMTQRLTRPPKAVGRPERYPLAAVILLGMLVHEVGSLQRVEVHLKRAWNWIRPTLDAQYPGYAGLAPGGGPPNRTDYRRYLERHGLHGHKLNEAFEEWAARVNSRVFPQIAPEGTLTEPAVIDTLVADGVHLPPLFRGDKPDEVDPETGEILRRRRRDPDAGTHSTGDGRKVTGTKFIPISRHHGCPNSLMILALRPEEDRSEAKTALQAFLDIIERYPHNTALSYDGAFRGKHPDVVLKAGYLPLVRPFDHSKDATPNPFIQTKDVLLPNGGTQSVDLYAADGHAAIPVAVNGSREYVPLDLRKFSRNPNADGTYRTYVHLRIPDDARVPAHLVGATLRIRADITSEDAQRGFNRPEHLRVYGPSHPMFDRMMGRRSAAESTNSWLKRALPGDRARGVGRDRQHADLVFAAMFRNLYVELAQAAAREQPPQPAAA